MKKKPQKQKRAETLDFAEARDPLMQVQSRIEESLVLAWEKQLHRDGIGKASWMRAAIRKYLAERTE